MLPGPRWYATSTPTISGIQAFRGRAVLLGTYWIPACSGMTDHKATKRLAESSISHSGCQAFPGSFTATRVSPESYSSRDAELANRSGGFPQCRPLVDPRLSVTACRFATSSTAFPGNATDLVAIRGAKVRFSRKIATLSAAFGGLSTVAAFPSHYHDETQTIQLRETA